MLDVVFSGNKSIYVLIKQMSGTLIQRFLLILFISVFLLSYSYAEDFQNYYPIPVSPSEQEGSVAHSIEPTVDSLDKIYTSIDDSSMEKDENYQGHMISTEVLDDVVKHAGQDYLATDFSVFKRELDLLRLQALSSTSRFNVEVPSKSQPENNVLSDSNLYQELIFHAALTGNRRFLFNNTNASSADESLLNNTLLELDQLLSKESYQSSVDGLIDWKQHFVLSSAEQGNRTIWRFTPNMGVDHRAVDTILSREPAQFKVGTSIITIPNSTIVSIENDVSAAGLWIVQNGQKAASSCDYNVVGQQCVEFFSNTTLEGRSRISIQSKTKDLTNIISGVDLVNNSWDLAGAGYGAGINAFSLRVSEMHELSAGKYELTATADDAVRLWVDGVLLINAWSETSEKSRPLSAEIDLDAGKHTIKLEYADYQDVAAVKLKLKQLPKQEDPIETDNQNAITDNELDVTPIEDESKQGEKRDEVITNTCVLIPDNEFCTEFYDGIALEGEPIHKRTDTKIDFYWKGESPQEGIIPENRFSTRWQGNFEFEESEYRFISSTDDGIRVWVDGEEIISSWKNQGTTEYFSDIKLTKGKHLVKVEYYENYGWATAKLRWEKKADCSGIPENKFCASYFNQDKAFEGEADRTYLTDVINHDVAKRVSPLHGIRNYKYSVRWVGNFDFEQEGYYQFNSDADDGLRIWLDDELITDTWKKPWPFRGKDQRVVSIPKGQHVVKVEYYQAWNEAKAIINWQYLEECSVDVKDAFCMAIYESRKLGELEGVKALPKYFKKVDRIDFDWQLKAPEELIRKDDYSVRWTGQHQFEQGNYRFSTSTDDGVRLFVDNKLVVNKWGYQREKSHDTVIKLEEGYHDIRMEYFQGWGKAAAHLNWGKVASCDDVELGQVCGTYFNSNDLSGAVADIQVSDKIDFDWGSGSPSEQINKNRFSARWVSTDNFDQGMYRFQTDIDDGVRIYVDDELVLDLWKHKWPLRGKRKFLLPLSEGSHTIKVEYRENWGSAKAKVLWEKAPDCSITPENAFCTEFFAKPDLSGDAVDSRLDTAIDFDWGKDQPTLGVWKDRFSMRSVGKFTFEENYYNFNAVVDDGMRVWLDDALIIDNWKRNWRWKGKENRVVKVAKGEHTVKVEMVEHYGSANAKLTWSAIEGCATTPENAYCMEVYEGKDLDQSGKNLAKYMAKTDNIDFDWKRGSPNEMIWADKFSIRWTGKHTFEAGDYRFQTLVDDGVRLWIDNELIIDQWRYRGNKPSNEIVTLTEGEHDIKMEYYEAWGNASAKLTWEKILSCDATPDGKLCAEYFNNRELEGSPADVQYVDAVDFDWERNAPTVNVNKDKFSVRWTGNVDFTEGLYRFRTADTDDGMRIYVDDEIAIDVWKKKWPWYGNQRVLKEMSEGSHKVVVEYREDWGKATAKAFWEKAPDCNKDVPNGEFCTSFYQGVELEAGKLLDTRIDKEINNEWGSKSPSENIPRDKFSVRWVGDFELEEGEYTFNVRTDDGFRLKVGDNTLIESWKGQRPTPYQKRVFLEAGTHRVIAEYYEAWGGATAQLNWVADQLGKPAMPTELSVTANSQDRVSLAWAEQKLAAGYAIYRDGVLYGTTTKPEFTDESVEVTKTYNYQVAAFWPNKRESDAVSIQVMVADTLVPSQPVGLSVVSTTPTTVSLTWDASSDNVAVMQYEVWRDQTLVAQVIDNQFNDSQLSSFEQYNYQIVAVDASSNRSLISNSLIVSTQDGTAPSIPQNLQAVLNASGDVELRWQASEDNIGVNAYQIFRDSELIGSTNKTSYIDTNLSENTSYIYHVIAVDSVGNASLASSTATLLSGDQTPPSIVNNLRAKVDDSIVNLSWDAATDNVAIANYRILRDDRAIALTKLTSYQDSSVEEGISYRYSIMALDASGNVSPASEDVDVMLGEMCEKTTDYFVNTVEPSLINCSSCHIDAGQAQATRFILSQSSNASSQNLSALTGITQILGSATILNKVSDRQSHGGGVVFAGDSDEYKQLEALLSQLENPQDCDVDGKEPEASEEPLIPVASLVGNCASCHGTEGASSGPATPSIAGLESHYLLEVMSDYQSGKRASTVMNRIMTGYTETQLKLMADYFAKQPHYVETQTVDSDLADKGKALHESYCSSCHSDSGRNASPTGTRLAGQWKAYMGKTLHDYSDGLSSASPVMLQNIRTVELSEEGNGLEALVEFYASISPDTQAPEAPEALDVAATTADSITLSWFDAEDDWSVSYYEIYRDGVLLTTTEFSVFTDKDLSAGEYAYRIVAVDSAGNKSIKSDVLMVILSSDDLAPDGAKLLDYSSTLRKSSLLLLGRVATKEERAKASSEASYKSTLREMLDAEKSLDKFVYRAAHETFLTEGAARAGSGAGIREEDFPALEMLSEDERRIVNRSIKKEPVYLLQHIVNTDRSWTESLTADYTVLNAALAKAMGANPVSGSFSDTLDEEEKLPSKISNLSVRLADKDFPHAGVLTTNAWLSRFPTTDTNRNRHRASNVYKQFLGVDIEALAQRPIDDSENGDFLVPTLENPNCMVCHTVMAPVAGAFKNWGTNNRYQQNHNGEKGDFNSLSRGYRSRNYGLNYEGERWYHAGDAWYRDMLKPGYSGQEMPDGFEATTGSQDSLQWLSQAIVNDPRFAKGSVYFWYRALFKRKPLAAPLDSSEMDYENRLAAFNEQDAILDKLAVSLIKNQGNGAWNIKDLLIDMTTTPLFRTYAQTGNLTAASDLGVSRLLTPEEVNRKLKSLTGVDWRSFRDDRVWSDRMGTFYGGFDGGNLQTTPNSKINSLMSKIPERMAIEMSCNIVYDEFRKETNERNLFRFVNGNDTPAFEEIDIAKNNILVNAGAENDLQGWVLETGSVRILSGDRGCDGGPSIKSGEKIFNPGSICENTTPLGIIYQQVDVTSWADLIDEGGVQALYGAALRGWSRDNDEASVYLTFHQSNGTEISRSEFLLGGSSEWKSVYDYIDIPAQTRTVRFHIQGRRISEHKNNDSFADDTYLRIILPGTHAPTLGEKKIRANIQFLHQHMLDESLAIDSTEVDRTYNLFKDVWASNENNGDMTCRLYKDYYDPDKTKRAWSIVLMYLMTDAKFLYE